ncbi:OmpA family protein [Magnetospirillum molischianum]|uniref:Lysophospholipase n=1 Tax=Magnetospirillum molischianum DSM 120 TaxID=1150626 RepID=H8FXR7_MAGML|nr:OmpA family protein [Magnetospirillum molischianum]CCG43155.1 Lysophospholipase [Magnetospirillum molischianum DSM 120]
MSRGGRLLMIAVGAVTISSTSLPASAQIVVGDSQSSVYVDLGVLDRLGPEPSLPGLMNHEVRATYATPAARPSPRPVAKAQPHVQRLSQPAVATVKPQQAKAKEKTPVKKLAPTRPAATVASAPAPRVAMAPALPERPKVERPKIIETPKPPEPVKVVTPVKPEPPKVELPRVVEAPKPPEPVKVVTPVKPEPPKVELPKVVETPKPPEPVKVVTPVKPEPPKVELPRVVEAPKPPEPVKVVTPVKPEPPKVELPRVVEAPKPPPTVLAAIPSASTPLTSAAAPLRKGDNLTIPFALDSARLSEGNRTDLERMAHRMERDETLSLQLLAYAAGDEANASKARRLSLSRALEVRKYLMEMGVRSTRIEVRALGNKIENGAPDRVDAVLTQR